MRLGQSPGEQRITQFIHGSQHGLRLAGNSVLLGPGTVLAKIFARGGLWETELRSDQGLAALLSAAYGRPIRANDHPVRAVKAAVQCLLQGKPIAAEEELRATRLDDFSQDGAARLLDADAMLKAGVSPREVWAKYNPDEPRDERGRWTDGDSDRETPKSVPATTSHPASAIPGIEFASAQLHAATEAEREKFTDDHLVDAEKVAKELNVPVENILGLSALESSWGRSHVATMANNYLGIHSPAPGATGYIVTAEGAKVATFASYADCLNSFVRIAGARVRNVSDPSQFASILQNARLFGIDPEDGSKVPTFVSQTAATIRGFRARIARRKA